MGKILSLAVISFMNDEDATPEQERLSEFAVSWENKELEKRGFPYCVSVDRALDEARKLLS